MFDPKLLENDALVLKTALAELYPATIHSPEYIKSIHGIEGGVQNFNYRVELTTGEQLFFSILRPEKGEAIDTNRLEGVTRFLDHINRRGVLCPAPKQSKDGMFFQTLDILENKPYCILSTWLPGKDVEVLDTTTAYAMGQSLGKFAEAGQDFDAKDMGSPLTLPSLKKLFLEQLNFDTHKDMDVAVGNTIRRLRERAAHTEVQPGKTILLSLADSLEEGLEDKVLEELIAIDENLQRYAKLPTTICHKDLHKGNILHTERGVAIVDPDWIGRDIAVYDLAMTVTFECLQKNGFDTEKAKAIIAGYDSIHPLNTEEKQALPSLISASAMRFFMRRFVNVMTAEPENIRRSPEEFFKRLKRLDYLKEGTLEKVIQDATAKTPEQQKMHDISILFQQFRNTPYHQHSSPELIGLAYAGVNAARDVAQGKEHSLEYVQNVLHQLRSIDSQDNKVQQLTVKIIDQMVTKCRDIALGNENGISQISKL